MDFKIKYLWAYSSADDWTTNWHNKNLKRRRESGYNIESFCVTPKYLNGGNWLPFRDLDRLWKIGDVDLMRMYKELLNALEGRDVLILYNGANLHPEFVEMLNVLKVYTVGDPESFYKLGKPVAPSFDIVLANHFADVERYKKIGLEKVYFWPLGSLNNEDETGDINEDNILDIKKRINKEVLFCVYDSARRKDRLNKLAKYFPEAFFAGKGWPRGFISWEKMWEMYRKTQIGWNIHNSTGFNFRTYELPAFGIMQICDDKSNLGKIFELGKEVIGFDTMNECVELTKYYIDHPEEQRRIALAGWRRWRMEYTPDKVWEKLAKIVEINYSNFENKSFNGKDKVLKIIDDHIKKSSFARFFYNVIGFKIMMSAKRQLLNKIVTIKFLKR